MRLRVFAAALLLASACTRASGTSTPVEDNAMTAQKPVVPVVSDAAGAAAQAGHEVLVQGIARSARLGAVVVNEDLHVYCLALGRWPAQAIGQPVVVRGRLELSSEFVAPEDGTAAGTEGPVWVLRDCRQEPR
jgi:hypothetical protein